MTNMKKLLSAVGVAAFGVLVFTNAVQAAPNLLVTSTVATYTVPHVPGNYTLNLWHDGVLQGTDSGSTGVLTVPVPDVAGCSFQADVQRDGQWYEGTKVTLETCGPIVTTTTSTTTTTTVAPTTTTTIVVTPSTGQAAHGGTCYTVCSPGPLVAPVHAPVVPKAPTVPAPLAFTGAPVGTEMLLGTGLLIGGGMLLAVRRRRGIRRA